MFSSLIKPIDNFLDRITMYRLVLYVLIAYVAAAMGLGMWGKIAIVPLDLVFTTLVILGVSLLTNKVFSLIFEAPTNIESVYITALILAMIIAPATSITDLALPVWAAILATAVKYILAIGKKHIFNPAAIAVVFTSWVLGLSANWWAGNTWMAPVVIAGGLLIVRKIRRTDMVAVFLGVAVVTITGLAVANGSHLGRTLNSVFLHSSLFFFAFIMLTEPLTTPPTKALRLIYSAIVGILFAPQIHIGSMYSTPELALIVGNIFSYLVSPKEKLLLRLSEKIPLARDTYDFVFKLNRPAKYLPGQYMEWTLAHPKTDARGNRRYFTLASSPTEDTLRIGVKFNPNGSSFKREMLEMNDQVPIVAGQLAGEFTLPTDAKQKCVFVAGGIGVTPYRSMIKYLIDKKEPRPIIVVYANKTADEIAYQDIFAQAERELGIKTIYALTDREHIPAGWTGKVGRIDENIIRAEIPDFMERKFYLSGPHAMVTGYEEVLRGMGVPKEQIKIDFFPGFV